MLLKNSWRTRMHNTTDPNEPENDSDDVDPLWEPEQLKREYDKTADDDDNLTRRQYVFKQI